MKQSDEFSSEQAAIHMIITFQKLVQSLLGSRTVWSLKNLVYAYLFLVRLQMEKSVRDLKFYITIFGHFFQTFAFLGDFRNCPKNKLPTLFSRIFKAHYEIIILLPTTTTTQAGGGMM